MSITEATIILPMNDNDGNCMTCELMAIEETILDRFGGFTRETVTGSWKNPITGKVYCDPAHRYTIAADWKAVKPETLIKIAQNAALMLEQICIYVCIEGLVTFVEPEMNVQVA